MALTGRPLVDQLEGKFSTVTQTLDFIDRCLGAVTELLKWPVVQARVFALDFAWYRAQKGL